jgi:hypothetical protein
MTSVPRYISRLPAARGPFHVMPKLLAEYGFTMRDTIAKPSLTQSTSRREFLLKSAGLFGVATMAGADQQLVALPTLNQRIYGREPADLL